MPEPEIPVRRRYLISRLKALRTSAGLTHARVAETLGWDRGKLNRLEQGRFRRLNTADIMALTSLYGATGEEAELLVQIARDSKKVNWWYRYSDLFPGPFLALEAEAEKCEEFAALVVPGLCQTRDYMQSLMASSLDVTVPRDEVEARLRVRAERQRSILEREHPPRLWYILDESVLRRQVGGQDVMRGQIQHLLELGQRPTIDIQILPYEVGAHAATGFAFLNFYFAGTDRVTYIETDRDGLYVEESAQLERYSLVFDRLQGSALSVEDSTRFLEDALHS
ncbi:helix-turn-helix domain-containing protein [Nocardiopsis sp. LDBS1602]|uniref:helix-turn-helix domain-containing protein n=1 Tax=Nocardiopsis sp. LDBS1602 TaxID=3109597 RepID=UPI002DBD03D1|nr:helix-turn-helix transcriptional regulator [Nocardiopsis sp. LDBS1602]MEC3891830.1 helix-turn-helix transcriptional regulator [Nocardiopsis sp. LDBS1602]